MTPRGAAAATAYGLLTFTAFLWAANAVAGRWAPGHVSPQVITTLRWAIACGLLLPLAGRRFAAEWTVLRPHWLRVTLMGGLGYTVFASLFYAAGAYTSAVNLALFQGAIPVLVILLNRLVYGTRVGTGPALGVALTLCGAALAATHGDLAVLTGLAFNRGDVLIFLGCVLYAGYTILLPTRPKVSGLTFFTAMALAAFVTSLPLLAAEWAAGRAIWPSREGWLMIAFVGLGPSLLSQLSFMRGVELIGPNRAGLFVNLVPIFGAGLAVTLVGERFGLTEAAALALVLGGIACAERLKPAPPPEATGAYSQTRTRRM
ncbi:DMT family transporter [Methylobacterium sp. NEAU 140]|uniref:DMT family transporter n=1 Tax=Methylobacterium sp. NEAU 140 TaxID=3064945 RepID=UPI002733CFBD|nr:DMT family transporter [Methylobacterium sp. NEAU 140]MDP4025721.1 DMT family transporter [Methylobacterium sp. NEAU 140]